MNDKALKTIREFNMLSQGDFVAVGVSGGAEIKLLADTKKFADHTFHVELIDNKGKTVPAFNDVVLGKGNKCFYKFRKPLNAQGKWKLQVREALTSLTKTVDLP